MEGFNTCKDELIKQLENIYYQGDMPDLGNEIGIVIARYFDNDNNKADFIRGLEHGISLTDGTHPTY